MTTNRHRVRIDGDILLTLDGDIVTIATPRYEPGIFFVHAELMEVHVVPKGEDWKVKLKTTGVTVPFQVLPFTVPAAQIPAFTAFVDRAKEARERSLRETSST
ncbi:hypothetical protein [Rhodococcus sp. MTM3W5.2]|uniref:hypothetical protein n=1 Tax=Rhodococcus sp. MTM3W5.2 TaxID=1805827 RepID=UPI0011AE4D5A|nr:hypothetical protein [Rhodococcus sp. MTM3W5.2]